jgi:hypothetical protein
VAARILIRRGFGRDLRAVRERLGQEITAFKEVGGACDDEGLLVQACDESSVRTSTRFGRSCLTSTRAIRSWAPGG